MHTLGWDILTEHNLTVSYKKLDFLLFKNSVLQAKERSNFESGDSFEINFLTVSDDLLTLLAVSEFYDTLHYKLRSDGYIAGRDLDNKDFRIFANNVVVFLNGKFVRPSCYTATDKSIRFHAVKERKSPTEEGYKDYTEWFEDDDVIILTETQDETVVRKKVIGKTYLNAYSLEGTLTESTTVRSSNGINFKSTTTPTILKGKIVVFVNGNIIPYSEMSFPGDIIAGEETKVSGALIIRRNLRVSDKVDILYFYNGFEFFEYKPKSGQTVFEGKDLNGNYLAYSAQEGAGIAQMFEFTTDSLGNVKKTALQWSSIAGVRKGFLIIANCQIDGKDFTGIAEIQDSNMFKPTVAVKIISEFGREEFDSSEWYMKPTRAKNIVSYLDHRTRETVAIPEILESFQLFFFDHYQDALTRLYKIRNIDSVEEDLLPTTLDMLGMRLDLTQLSESNKRRSIREVVNFYKRCGTKNSVNFLGFIQDKIISVEEALWTNDYIHFMTPTELGATYSREALVDFTDYRFVAATPVQFDDYGTILDEKTAFELKIENTELTLPEGSRAFFPNHWEGVGYSMNWVSVNDILKLNTEGFVIGNTYYLVVVDILGNQYLDLVYNIPTYKGDEADLPLYYYRASTKSIMLKTDYNATVSTPLAKIYIDEDYKPKVLQEYKTFAFVDDYVFATAGISFSYPYLDEQNIWQEEKIVKSNAEVVDVSKAQGKNYLVYYKDDSDFTKMKFDYIPSTYYTNTGLKPHVNNCAMWKNFKDWYIYDNTGVDGKIFYDADGNIEKNEIGMTKVRYEQEKAWHKVPRFRVLEELPSCSTDEEIELLENYEVVVVNGIYYSFTKLLTLESEKYEEEGHTLYRNYETYTAHSRWNVVTRFFTDVYEAFDKKEDTSKGYITYYVHLLSQFPTSSYITYEVSGRAGYDEEFLPFFEGEICYDLLKKCHLQFINKSWKQVSLIALGEFTKDGRADDKGKTFIDKFVATDKIHEKFILTKQNFIDLENTLEVKVNGVVWKKVSSLEDYKIYPDEPIENFQVYILAKNNQGLDYVMFGDNEYGVKPEKDSDIEITYKTFDYTTFERFIPYEKWQNDLNILDILLIKDSSIVSRRFDNFTNINEIDLNSLTVYVNGEEWGFVTTSLEDIKEDEKKILIKKESAESMYLLTGDGVHHGKAVAVGSTVRLVFIPTNKVYIENRAIVIAPTFATSCNRVAYDYGLITDDLSAEWVWKRHFIVPEGFYPTNHLLFYTQANGLSSSIDNEASSRYQFYEIASTPWVLDKTVNILNLDPAYFNLASTMHSCFDLFTRYYRDRNVIEIKDLPVVDNITVQNTSFDNVIYKINKNNESGDVNNIKKIKNIFQKELFSVMYTYILYETTTGEITYDLESSFEKLNPREIYNYEEGDRFSVIDNDTITVSLSKEGYTEETYIINSQDKIIFKPLNKKVTLKVKVNTPNTLARDVINIYINGALNKQGEEASQTYFINCNDRLEIPIEVKQNGCNDYSETLVLGLEDFIDDVYEEEIDLTLAEYTLCIYGPESYSQISANGEVCENGHIYTYKYGTKVEYFAICKGYNEATEREKETIVIYKNEIANASLTRTLYGIKVKVTVNGKEDSSQPVYLNNRVYTTTPIWTLGQKVLIIAGGKTGQYAITKYEMTISSNSDENQVTLECPTLFK